jgi:hypothetical protein
MITNVFCIVQRATAQSKTGIDRAEGAAKSSKPAGLSACIFFALPALPIQGAHRTQAPGIKFGRGRS